MKQTFLTLVQARAGQPTATAFLPILVAAFGLVTGCDLPDRPKLDAVASSAPRPTGIPVNDEILEPPTALDQPTFETWDTYFINNKHIGYSHVTASPTTSATSGDVLFELDHRIYQFKANGARVLQRLVMSSNESTDGRLVGFDGAQQLGLALTRSTGSLDGSNLVIEVRNGSKTERTEIPWEYNYRGMFAVEQSLRAKPMIENGETRALKMLIPGRSELATARLRCSGRAVVPLMDGSEQELTEINVQIESENTAPTYLAFWSDADGKVVRTFSSAQNIIAYRTDQAKATQIENDNLVPVSIAVGGKMERPNEVRRVAFRVRSTAGSDGEAAIQIKPGPGQFVRSTENGETQVLVSRQEEKPTGGFIADEPIPTSEDTRANFFVDSDSDIVIKFADAAIGKRKLSKLELARELAGTAKRMVVSKPDRCGLVKASEVARVGSGDCAQTAVLLAALLRTQKIPSRIAVGLRFSPETEFPPQPQQMIAHVWTLAYTGDQWVHLDATEGDVAAADRILFATTNLGEENENEVFDAIISDIGRLEIEVLTAKY